MIDGIDYFPKRDRPKKGTDQEWDDLKKAKLSQRPGKKIVPGTGPGPEKEDSSK